MKKHRILMASTIVLNIGLSPLSVAAAPKVDLVQMTEASEAADAIRAPREWANPVPILHDLSEEVEERLPIEDEWTEDEWQDEASSATAYQTEAVGREGDQSGVWGEVEWRYDDSTGTIHLGEGQSDVLDGGENDGTRPWQIIGETNVRIIEVHAKIRLITTRYFSGLTNLEEIINAGNFDTSNVTNMDYMFSSCQSLTSLDISNWDTSNVLSMTFMFSNCQSLTSLDISNWDTSNVTNMTYMFSSCQSLTSLDISNWDTSNVRQMSSMFSSCYSLISLDISNWNTSSLMSIGSMFSYCRSLVSLDLNHFDTSGISSMYYMFDGCSSLVSLELSDWDTSRVTSMRWMFRNCSSLTSLDISKWDVARVLTMESMFSGCRALPYLDVSDWNVRGVSNMESMFQGAQSLTELDVSKWEVRIVNNMTSLFSGCLLLTSLDVSNWNTSYARTMNGMFANTRSLTSLDITNFDTSRVTTMASMFSGASGLTELDLSSFDTTNLTNMNGMFSNTTGLTSIDINHFDTANVTTMANMFSGASGFTDLDLSNFDTANVITMASMFSGASGLTNLDLSNFDTSKVTTMASMFSNADGLKNLDLSSFDTSKVTTMSGMFSGVSSLEHIDVNHFDTSNVTTMSSMFSGANVLESLDISNWNMSRTGTNGRTNMFTNTVKLSTLILGENNILVSSGLPNVPNTDGNAGVWFYAAQSLFFTTSQLMNSNLSTRPGRYTWASWGEDITFQYKDVTGNTLAAPQTISGYQNQTYEATIQSILGWSFVEADGPLSGIFTQDKQEITLIYELADAKIHDPINPAAEIHPAHLPDTAEELKSLRIDFAPTLNFGVGTISTTDQAYYAEPLQLAEEQNERPNFVQISHFHPEQPGWRLTLQQKEQMMTSQGEALTGAVIEFTQGSLVSVHNRTRPSEYLSDFQLVPGKSTQLIKAEANQGMGTWLYPFGDTATQDQSIQLHVPAKTNPRAQTYEAILTWSLEIVP